MANASDAESSDENDLTSTQSNEPSQVNDENDDNIVNSKKKCKNTAKVMDINVENNEKGNYTRANNKILGRFLGNY